MENRNNTCSNVKNNLSRNYIMAQRKSNIERKNILERTNKKITDYFKPVQRSKPVTPERENNLTKDEVKEKLIKESKKIKKENIKKLLNKVIEKKINKYNIYEKKIKEYRDKLNELKRNEDIRQNAINQHALSFMDVTNNNNNSTKNSITVNKFKSGKFAGLTYKEIIKDKKYKKNLQYLSNNKHPAYSKFNEYYKNYINDKANKIINLIKNNKNKVKELLKNSFGNYKLIEENKYNDGEYKLYENEKYTTASNDIVIYEKFYTNNSGIVKGVDYTLLPLLLPTFENFEFKTEINKIANSIFSIINNFKVQNMISDKEYVKFALVVKLESDEEENISHATMNINDNETKNIEGVEATLKRVIRNFSGDYEAQIVKLDTLKAFVVKVEEDGGCQNGKHDKINNSGFIPNIGNYINIPNELFNDQRARKIIKIKIINPLSKNNNCGLVCLIKSCGLKANQVKPDSLRKKYNIALNSLIGFEKLGDIANLEFRVNLIIINPLGKELLNTNTEFEKTTFLLLEDGHYKLIDLGEFKTYKKCDLCGRKLLTSNIKHNCNTTRKQYYLTQITKQMLPLKDNRKKKMSKNETKKIMDEIKELEIFGLISKDEKKKIIYEKFFKQEINYNTDVLYFDFETVQINRVFEVYAVGVIDNGEMIVFYGQNALNDFVDYLLNNVKNKYLCAFNGGRFDNIILFKELINRNIELGDYLKNNGRLMQYCFNGNKMFDLYNHIGTSLDKACNDYKISSDKNKLEFDHSKINNWDDVEKNKDEVINYLKRDVISMKELFYKLNKEVYEMQGINITDYLTSSATTFDCFRRSIYEKNKNDENKKIMIEIPNIDAYKIIKKSVYGGRVCSYQKYYKSSYEGNNYEELLKSGDYIFNADVNSLYPAAMVGNELMSVKYPVGPSRINDNGEEEFNNGKIGFYDISYIPPKNINYPILPRRLENGGISWDLLNGSGFYTSVDIEDAISVGYEIKFNGNCLVYDDSREDLFKDYINKWYNIKKCEDEKPEEERNNARRNLSKLMMNSLYGKMLQRANFENETIAYTLKDIYNFLREYELTDWTFLVGDKILLKGKIKDEKENKAITKPMQLGAFVLSYSRRLMLYYNKIIDPTLKELIATYSDTDSMHIKAKHYLKLVELGLINDGKMGFMSNDLKKDGLIIEEINLGSKIYMYKYINNENKLCTTMKSKGIPNKCLEENFYREEKGEIIIKNSFKKVFDKTTKEEKNKDIEYYTIRKIDIKRTFNLNSWAGRRLINNIYYAHGYEGNELY